MFSFISVFELAIILLASTVFASSLTSNGQLQKDGEFASKMEVHILPGRQAEQFSQLAGRKKIVEQKTEYNVYKIDSSAFNSLKCNGSSSAGTFESEGKTWLENLSFIGTFGAFLVAVLGGIFAGWQYLSYKKEGRRNLAYQNYSDFLRFEFENSEYSRPREGKENDRDEHDLKYKLFVANMLFAFEQIYPLVKDEPLSAPDPVVSDSKAKNEDLHPEDAKYNDWLATMRIKIRRHKTYLRNSTSFPKMWKKDFRDFVQSVLNEKDH